MPGGNDRSLLRLLQHEQYAERARWHTPADVPAAAVEDLQRPDQQTSAWDEGATGETRDNALLSLALRRKRIGRMQWGSFWAGAFNPPLAGSFEHDPTIGGPFAGGHTLHYELRNPGNGDHERIAFAIGTRNEIDGRDVVAVRDLLEDGLLEGKFVDTELGPELTADLNEMLSKRVVKPAALASSIEAGAHQKIVDIRVGGASRIPTASVVGEDEMRKAHMIPGHAKTAAAILYCDDGRRSRALARVLRGYGCINVRILDGGFAAWQAAGLPTT